MHASGWRADEYEEIKGRRVGYKVFDSKVCAYLPIEELGNERSSSCYLKNVIYMADTYEWAYAMCFRPYLVAGREAVNPICNIRSRVRPEVYVSYISSSASVEDGSWIDIDKRVRRYINELEYE